MVEMVAVLQNRVVMMEEFQQSETRECLLLKGCIFLNVSLGEEVPGM